MSGQTVDFPERVKAEEFLLSWQSVPRVQTIRIYRVIKGGMFVFERGEMMIIPDNSSIHRHPSGKVEYRIQ